MRTLIPAPLKWLADKRARIASEIKQLEARLKAYPAELAATRNALSAFREDLRAVDRAMALHEIQIDPESIPDIHSGKRISPFAHGQMTKLIHGYLRSRKSSWSTTTEVASFVWAKAGLSGEEITYEFRLSVRHRLKVLAREGRIERSKTRGHWAEAFWRGNQSSGAMSSHKIS